MPGHAFGLTAGQPQMTEAAAQRVAVAAAAAETEAQPVPVPVQRQTQTQRQGQGHGQRMAAVGGASAALTQDTHASEQWPPWPSPPAGSSIMHQH
jgi:hypothetical protein